MSNNIICQQKTPVFVAYLFQWWGGAGRGTPPQLFLLKLHFKTLIFNKALKKI